MLLQLYFRNKYFLVLSVAVGRASQADVLWDLFCVSKLTTYIIVVKGGAAILGRVSPSEVIWRG